MRFVPERGGHDSSSKSASIAKTAAFKGGKYTCTTFHINVSETLVFVPQDVANTGDLRPRDLRLLRLEFRRNAAGRFGHDLDAALNAVAEKPIAAEVVWNEWRTKERSIAPDASEKARMNGEGEQQAMPPRSDPVQTRYRTLYPVGH
jgi:hypothetical protein